MNEISELESGIDKLRKDSQSKRMLINALEKEKAGLLKKSDELSQRLTRASEDYKESSRKIMEYVNSQVSQLRIDMAGLSNSMGNLSGLEKKLESQERSHEKALSRIGKELVGIEKSLSDVSSLRAEVSRQGSAFEEARLQMEKGIQSGMAYLRKEMDVNRREDARKALEEFRQEIERISSIESELNAYKRSQESRVDALNESLSSLKSSIADVRMLKEKSGLLESASRNLEKGLEELSSRQKTASSLIANELSAKLGKGLESLKKELESRRSEDSKAQLREFRQEIERISSLESAMRENSKRLDSIGRELSSLQPVAGQVAALQEKTEENLHMNHSLADRTVSSSDFEKAMRAMAKRTEELESRLLMVDRKLSSDKSRLEKSILEVLSQEKFLEGTQENIKQWFDGRFQDIEKRVSTGIDALTTQIEEGSSLVDRLRTRSQKMDILTKEIPPKLEQHTRTLTSLLDFKADLSASMESLSGDIRSISGEMSSSLQRIASLEKSVSSADKTSISVIERLGRDLSSQKEKLGTLSSGFTNSLEKVSSLEKSLLSFDKANRVNMGRFSSDLSAFQQELKNQSLLLKEFSDSSRLDVAGLRQEVSSALKTMGRELDSRIREASQAGIRELREKTRGLASMRDLETELKAVKLSLSKTVSSGDFKAEMGAVRSAVSEIESRSNELAQRISGDLESVKAAIDKRLSELTEEQSSRFRRDFNFITKNIDSIRDIASDIKIFKARVRGLEGLSKTMVSEQDFALFRKDVDSRISGMEASGAKAVEALSGGLSELRKSVESEKLTRKEFTDASKLIGTRLQDISAMAKSSSDELKKDMASFKKLVDSRFSEIRDSRLREFKDETARISQLEQTTDARNDAHEKRLDELSDSLASLQSMPPEIGMLREKIDSLEEMSGHMVYSREFSQKVSEINTTLDQFRKGLAGLDKRMHSHAAGLEASIREAFGEEKLLKKSQEGMNALIDSRVSEIEKRLSSGIRGLVNDLSQSSAALSGLKENMSALSSLSSRAEKSESSLAELRKRVDSIEFAARDAGKKASSIDDIMKRLSRLESLSRNITENSELLQELGGEHSNLKAMALTLPKTVDKHSEAISRILESKEFLAESVAGLRSDVRGLSEKLSSSQQRLASLEKGVSSGGSSSESRIASLSSAIESINNRLESGRDEIKEFREHIASHVDSVASSFEKKLSEAVKGGSARSAADLSGLREKVREIESLTKELSRKAVPESEFIETVRSISKRIDDIEKIGSDNEKSSALSSARLDSAVSRVLSKENILEASQKHVREMFESRLKELKASLSESMSGYASRLESGLSDISALKQEVSSIKSAGMHSDSDMMAKVDGKLSSHSKIIDDMGKKLGSVSGRLSSLNDRVMEEKSRISALEQRFASSLESQKTDIREMLMQQKAAVDSEIDDEAARIIKDAEIGELRRSKEFENLLRKFQDLHIKTKQNLDDISSQRESFLELEKSLKDRMAKATSSLQSRLYSDHEKLKKRIEDSEALIMKLNNMISELHVARQKERAVKTDFKSSLSGLREEMIDRMKTNEDMFDTEMDAFRKKIEGLSGQVSAWKDFQKSMSRVPGKKEDYDMGSTIEDMSRRLSSSREEMKQFKEYVIGYMNNLVSTYEGKMKSIKDEIKARA